MFDHFHGLFFFSSIRIQNVELAKAEGEKIKKIGLAEAYTIDAIGKAEAERMRMKASAYKQYGEAAVMALVLDALPKVTICFIFSSCIFREVETALVCTLIFEIWQIAAEIAAPLGKTDEIVLLGNGDGLTNDVSRLVSQLPPAVQALTGVDVSKVTNTNKRSKGKWTYRVTVLVFPMIGIIMKYKLLLRT